MGNATSVLVDRLCLDYFKQNKTLQDGCQSCARQKPHDTRNGEDTKGTLQVLLLCTIKRVIFIVDISNINITKIIIRWIISASYFVVLLCPRIIFAAAPLLLLHCFFLLSYYLLFVRPPAVSLKQTTLVFPSISIK